jgi:hypothetical protein
MKGFLSEDDTLIAIRNCCRKASKVKAALALITLSGLRLIEEQVQQFLARGGEFQLLLGIDMATEPDAIMALLTLQARYCKRMTIRRFITEAGSTLGLFIEARTPCRDSWLIKSNVGRPRPEL